MTKRQLQVVITVLAALLISSIISNLILTRAITSKINSLTVQECTDKVYSHITTQSSHLVNIDDEVPGSVEYDED